MLSGNCAYKYRAGCPLRGAPLSASAAFGRGGLRPAASFRPACAVTSSRHGEFGASTPKYRCRCLRGGGINNATRSRNSLALSRSSFTEARYSLVSASSRRWSTASFGPAEFGAFPCARLTPRLESEAPPAALRADRPESLLLRAVGDVSGFISCHNSSHGCQHLSFRPCGPVRFAPPESWPGCSPAQRTRPPCRGSRQGWCSTRLYLVARDPAPPGL